MNSILDVELFERCSPQETNSWTYECLPCIPKAFGKPHFVKRYFMAKLKK